MYNILIYILPIFLFSLFDYFGYNVSRFYGWVDENTINKYRIVQLIVQFGILAFTVFSYGFIPGLVFIILWWSWVADWLYYLIDYFLFLGFNSGYERGSGLESLYRNGVTWAWWTWGGLIFHGGKKEKIEFIELLTMSLIGILACIIILL